MTTDNVLSDGLVIDEDLVEYRALGQGTHGADWEDKPHRLVFDLIRLTQVARNERDAACATTGTFCKFKIGDVLRYQAWGGFDQPTITKEQAVDAVVVRKDRGIYYEFFQGDGVIQTIDEKDCELVAAAQVTPCPTNHTAPDGHPWASTALPVLTCPNCDAPLSVAPPPEDQK